MSRSLSLLLLLVAPLSACSIWHDLEPIAPKDMTGCTPSPACGVVEDMHVPGDGGDAGMCTLMCPGDGGPDMAPDLRPMCLDSSTCPVTAPICVSGRCNPCNFADMPSSVECAAYHVSTSPPTPLCGPAGACVECLSKDDCAATNRTCNLTTNTCAPCVQHTDCSTGVCKSGGVCASPGEVAYVNNKAGSGCSDTPHTSSPAMPFCKIMDNINSVSPSPKPYMVVTGSGTTYDPVTLTATIAALGPFTVIGPGRNASPTAKIVPSTTGPAVSVSAAGNAATLTIDGLELTGTAAPAAKCQQTTSGTPTLTVVNSSLHDSGQYGVDASASCAITLDADEIYANAGGGVSLANVTYTVTNTLIRDNGLGGPGVLMSGNVSGLWWFDTVAGNKRSGTNAGAFNCGGVTSGTPPLIQATIVWGNDKTGGASIVAGCNYTYTDIDDMTTPTGAGNFNQDPMFTTTAAGPDRIASGSPCKDKITAATGLTGGTLPTHDVDQHTRPRATGGYDVGGSQAP